MSRDDPIALLRALDPADEKEIDALVCGLAPSGALAGSVQAASRPASWRARRLPLGRVRLALVAAAAVATAIVVAAMVANPFSDSATISAAEAKQQAAAALDLEGGWHVKRIWRTSQIKDKHELPSASTVTEDAWHGRDGRLMVETTILTRSFDPITKKLSKPAKSFGVCCSLTLFANGEQLTYTADRKTTYVRHFASAGDLRDAERAFLPPSATDLYRAAFRDGRVRLSSIEKLNGRRVYRLAFDWLGSSYTLIFDADRRVPISSEARTLLNGVTGVTRTRYLVFERVRPGPQLEQRLTLPPAATAAAQDRSASALRVPRPVAGASARPVSALIARRFEAYLGLSPTIERATYTVVRPLAGGGIAAVVVLVPKDRSTFQRCTAVVEIVHAGGDVNIGASGCGNAPLAFWSSNRKTAMIAGTTTARRMEFHFDQGAPIRATIRGRTYLALLPSSRVAGVITIVTTQPDGSVTVREAPHIRAAPANPG